MDHCLRYKRSRAKAHRNVTASEAEVATISPSNDPDGGHTATGVSLLREDLLNAITP